LDGYFIAKIEKKNLTNGAVGIVYKNILKEVKTAIISEKLSDNQSVTISLIKTTSIENSKIIAKNNFKSLLLKISISENELKQFLLKTGDKNSIHFGEKPIVPGFLILEKLFENLTAYPPFFNIKFYNPLFLQKDLLIYEYTDNEIIGISENKQIIKFQSN
jgi:hypothetical protein